jgi:hypothetical protein
MDNGEPMLKNAAREIPRVGLDAEEAEVPRGVPAGCVERILSFRDRNFIIGACRAFCEKDGHKGFKDQAKLSRLNKLLAFEETLEYFAEFDDTLEDLVRAWTRQKRMYKLRRDVEEGVVKAGEFEKEFPGIALESVEKPTLRPPENSKEDMKGAESHFYLPSKLDVWVQDALRAMEWNWSAAEFSVDLCAKFGVTEEA